MDREELDIPSRANLNDVLIQDRGSLPACRRPKAYDAIARELGTAILTGTYPPGHRFADEIVSSRELNVSRSAYRDALRMLAERGLIESSPKVGTVVTPRQNWNLLDPIILTWTFSSEPDLNLLESLFELRILVECSAAASAATRRTDEQLKRLKTAVYRMQQHTLRTEAGLQADREFHVTLLRSAANPYLASLAASVVATVDATNRFKLRHHALSRDPVPDHINVFLAIESRDSEKAKTEMERLIRQAFLDMTFI